MKKFIFTIFVLVAFSASSQIRQLGTDTIRMNVTVQQAKTIVDTNGLNPDFIIIDVRTPSEYIGGHIANAINIDYYSSTFGQQLSALDHNKMYLIHCASGGRSPKARDTMIKQHFREIYHLSTGFSSWLSAGYPYVTGYTGIESSNNESPEIFPNPITNQSKIYLKYVYQQLTFEVFNLQGIKIADHQFENVAEISINKDNFPYGCYFIRLIGDGKLLLNKKVLVTDNLN
jgi:rhodanese-related sulfurtransferase